MYKNYRELLENKHKEAMEQFEQAKADAIKAIEDMTTYNAADFGAAYFTKIDKITQAGQKVLTLEYLIWNYDCYEVNEKIENIADEISHKENDHV